MANETTACPFSYGGELTNESISADCSLYAVQLTGRWLDAAGFEPGQAIQCGTNEQVTISNVAIIAFALYVGQVFYHSITYARKSSVIIADQKFMLIVHLLKILFSRYYSWPSVQQASARAIRTVSCSSSSSWS